jgi:cell division protein FtsA
MARTFTAIDVGTSKICTILAELDEAGAMGVLSVGVVPSQGMRKGVVVDIDGAKRRFRRRCARFRTAVALR